MLPLRPLPTPWFPCPWCLDPATSACGSDATAAPLGLSPGVSHRSSSLQDEEAVKKLTVNPGTKSKLPTPVQDLSTMIFDVESMKKAMVEYDVTAPFFDLRFAPGAGSVTPGRSSQAGTQGLARGPGAFVSGARSSARGRHGAAGAPEKMVDLL